MTEQEREIETIKERTFTLKLSDADVKRVWKKAGEVGLTASELLEQFIGDLVHGTYSNGSDERMRANEWFDRCWFGMFPDKTFLRYLLYWTNLEDTLELWDDIKTAKEELEYSKTHKDEFEEDEIEGWKADLSYWEEQLNDTFSRFKEWAKDEKIDSLEEEIEKVIKWNDEMNSMCELD